MTQDRDLLCALFAQQLGLAPAAAIFRAGVAWLPAQKQGQRFSEALVHAGVMDAPAAALVEGLVDEALALHRGDASQTLKSLPPAMRSSLDAISATLLRATPGPDASFDSLETPENVGTEARGRYSEDTGPHGEAVELGRGGVGRVVVVRDHVLQRDVALKELLRDITTNPKYETLHIRGLEARFLREARVTGQLEHPAVVPVYELGRRRDGTLYFTMLQVKGRTLAQAFTDARTLEGRLAFVPDLLTVCRAIASAHHRGVIHRDLKPQNIMLGSHGETYVMDWGLARVLGRPETEERPISLAPDLTHGTDAGPVGTPSYMSPEQAWGEREQIDEKSDVWGLGALLFELLAGRAPFIGPSPWDVLAEVRSQSAPPVSSLAPDAPPELAAICDKALRRKKEDRYASAEAMAKDVEAWLSGQRVGAYEYTAREALRRLAKRHRAFAVVAVAALAGLLVLGGVTAWRVRRERDEARAMATFFLKDVRKELAQSTQSAEVLEQLSHSALEVYAASLDLESGPRDDRLLLVDAWLDVAATRWQSGREAQARDALAEADRALVPLERQFPDDVEVLERRLRQRVREADLLLDQGDEAGAEKAWVALRGLSSRVAAAVPQTAEHLAAPELLEARLAMLFGNAQRLDDAFTAGQRAVALGEARLALAPGDPVVMSEVADDTVALGWLHEVRGERPHAVEAYQRAINLLRDARSRRDSYRLQRALLAALRVMISATPAPRRGPLLAEAHRLADELLAVGPSDTSVLLDAASIAVLEGSCDHAWAFAQRLDEASPGPEYKQAVLETAFACGHDEVLLARADDVIDSVKPTVQVLVSFSHALKDELPEAATAARAAVEKHGMRLLSWYGGALRARAAAARGEGARAVLELVDDVELHGDTPEQLDQAFARYAERLERLAREAR